MCCIVAGLLAATSAMALDQRHHTPQLNPVRLTRPASTNAVLGCDDGVTYSGWYQGTDDRLGNLIDFGTGSVLSTVSFVHYDYGNPGPYNYNLEIWDPTSCTFVAAKNNLVAADIPNSNVLETVDLCSNALYLSGYMVVTIDPNSCVSATDCYPDLVFDDQVGVQCPVIIATASTSPTCYDVSSYGGPFLLRVETNGCATPTHRESWGHLKSIYR
jgi:hypothetical protein